MEVIIPSRLDRFQTHHNVILGSGTYGRVYRGAEIGTNVKVAIKHILLRKSDRLKNCFDREVRALKSSSHPNIVRILYHQKTDDSAYLVLEFCDFNLETLAERNELHPDLKPKFVEEIVSAVHCLHEKGFLHRDIKPENILVKLEEDTKTIKLTDFGWSKWIPDDGSSGSSDLSTTALAGTELWMAPEVFPDDMTRPRAKKPQYGRAADCFSLGLVLDQLLSHRSGCLPPPVKGPDGQAYGRHLKAELANGVTVQERNVDGDDAIYELIHHLLCPKWRERCDIKEALRVVKAWRETSAVLQQEEVADAEVPAPVQGDATHNAPGHEHSAGVPAALPSTGLPPPPPQAAEPQPSSTPTGTPTGSTNVSAGNDEAAADAGADAGAAQSNSPVEEEENANQVEKVGHISLEEDTTCPHLFFDPAKLLVGFESSPYLYYYERQSGTFELMWRKKIPAGHRHNCVKNFHPEGGFYLQSGFSEVCLYDGDLNLVEKLSSPGAILGLLPGGQRAVVNNRCQESTWSEGLRLRVTSARDLHEVIYELQVPADGPYARDDAVWVRGLDDGQLAVVVGGKSFCDLYDDKGHHRVRARLKRGVAGVPSCWSGGILIPLHEGPEICVLNWSGKCIYMFDRQELGLLEHDEGFQVSPVHEKSFSFYVVSQESGEHQIHTYQAIKK